LETKEGKIGFNDQKTQNKLLELKGIRRHLNMKKTITWERDVIVMEIGMVCISGTGISSAGTLNRIANEIIERH